jgi:4-hydroxythreonine-4-phosphate dehydrogenase
LVGFKTLAFGLGVNITAGLPYVRTSPDHGTAFDIAGKGVANHASFAAAVQMAFRIYNNRQKKH